jgi:hypothetical protein
MTHPQNEDEAPEEAEVTDFERRFAELMKRFWQLPQPPAATADDGER